MNIFQNDLVKSSKITPSMNIFEKIQKIVIVKLRIEAGYIIQSLTKSSIANYWKNAQLRWLN